VTRVILWKEMREQAHVAATLLVVAVSVTVGAKALSEAQDVVEIIVGLAALFAWVFGLVAGAQLLAGEQENGTQSWLDTLPVARLQVGRRKAVAGVALTLAQAVLLWLVLVVVLGQAFFFGRGYGPNFAIVLLLMSVVAVCGFAGGLFGSAVAHSTLGAVGWGILAQSIAISAGLFFASVVFLGAAGTFFLLPLAISIGMLLPAVRRYTSLDRIRQQSVRVLTGAGPATRRVVLWLAWRQGRGVYWLLFLAGVAAAIVVPLVSPLAWPLVGALLGAVAGLMAFGPDQNGSAYRMLGDRRLPFGTIWNWKVALPIAIVGITVVVMALNLLARFMINGMESSSERAAIQRHLLWLRSGLLFAMLVLGPLYGFATGQFFAMIYRKTVVAAVMALVASLAAVLLWLPSIALGGLHVWQWLAPPVVLLVASRAAMRPWVSGRIGSLPTAAGLACACVVAAGTLAAGIAYRMFEWPAPSAAFDHRSFERSLSTVLENEGGPHVRQALEEFARESLEVGLKYAPSMGGGGEGGGPAAPPGFAAPPGLPVPAGDQGPLAAAAPQIPPMPDEPSKDLIARATEALTDGWPAKDDKLNRWLDELVRGEWTKRLALAVGKPVGVPFQPFNSDTTNIELVRQMGLVLVARSLQLQNRVDFDAALQPLELALALSANLQSFANGHQLSVALIVERQALAVLGDWANGVGARPELLRRALAAALVNDRGQTAILEVVDVEFGRAFRAAPSKLRSGQNDFERTLIQFAGAVVWETERDRRLVEAVREGYVRYASLDFRAAASAFAQFRAPEPPSLGASILWRWVGKSGAVAHSDEIGRSLTDAINSSSWLEMPSVFVPELSLWYNVQTQLRGSIIRLALMLYQCDHGRMPGSLDALVPDYLKTVPTDPYGGGFFHYRISSGERIRMFHTVDESKAYRDVPSGAAIVWSVGPDLNDDGGRIQEPNTQYKAAVANSDVLFIVPRLQKP
jgi:ABC-type transport system involved in multi-copper enzyme maturation permease subunit